MDDTKSFSKIEGRKDSDKEIINFTIKNRVNSMVQY